MSDVLPYEPVRVRLRDGVAVGTSVALARLLAHAPPDVLRSVLDAVSAGARPADYEQARAARDTVLTASAYTRGGSACLPRSIATALICRLRGTWPAWCVGVLSSPPFTAHAWIEAEGRIVDEPMNSSDFSTFFSVTAAATASTAATATTPTTMTAA